MKSVALQFCLRFVIISFVYKVVVLCMIILGPASCSNSFYKGSIYISWLIFFFLMEQVAILIGSSASSVDLSREIAEVAKEVHVTSRSVSDETYQEQPGFDNMWLHSMVKELTWI